MKKGFMLAAVLLGSLLLMFGCGMQDSGSDEASNANESQEIEITSDMGDDETTLEAESFVYGQVVTEKDGKLFMLDGDGFECTKADDDSYYIGFTGDFGCGMVTNGHTVYYYDRNELAIMSYCVDDNKTTKVTEIYDMNDVDEEAFEADYYGDADIVGYYDGKIYCEEWYGFDYVQLFAYDLEKNTYEKQNMDPWVASYSIQFYGDKIYFQDMAYELTAQPIYQSDLKGNGIKQVVSEAFGFHVKDGVIYYSIGEESKKGTPSDVGVYAYDLKTGTTKKLLADLYAYPEFTDDYIVCSVSEPESHQRTRIEVYDYSGKTVTEEETGMALVSKECALVPNSVGEYAVYTKEGRSGVCELPSGQGYIEVFGCFGGEVFYSHSDNQSILRSKVMDR